MKFKTSLLVTLMAVVAVLAVGIGVFLQRGSISGSISGGGSAQDTAILATPPGITLQGITPLGKPLKFYYASGSSHGLAYANSQGMTLYTYDMDTQPGKSACSGDCAKAWPPAAAAANAKPFGDWSVVPRDDGIAQWAYKGKPLYAFAKDGGVGDNKGDGAGNGIWHVAFFRPAAGISVPYGMSLQEVADVSAQILVDDQSMTLYAFDGDVQHDQQACSATPCSHRWLPVSAPQLAHPIGAFSMVIRADGSSQWAYNGKALYRFADDLQPGDANGTGMDKNWHPASVIRYFLPTEASIQPTSSHGFVLATAQGMTLYRRDTSYHTPSGHGLRHSVPGVPTWGRLTGTRGCNAECLKVWHPFVASASDQPSGYWDILTRDDGTRQWAYRGYALYSYAGDKKPGETTGNDIYDILTPDDLHDVQAVYDQGPVPTTSAAIQYWAHAEP